MTHVRIEVSTPQITINIPDKVVNQTIIKRKAELFTLLYNQHSKEVALNWTIKSFANDNGDYGALIAELVPDTSVEMVADNTTFVNPATGEILTPDPVTGEYSMDYVGQYDFFYSIAAASPIVLHNLITQYGNQHFNQ